MNWFPLALLAATAWGLAGVIGRAGVIRLKPHTMLLFYGFTLMAFYFVVWLFIGKPFPRTNYLFPLLSEGTAAIAFIFYYRAMEIVPASVIVPITSSYIIISVLLGIFLFHNPVSLRQILAIALIFTGILFLMFPEKGFKRGKWLVFAGLATLFWGIWGGFTEMSVRYLWPLNLNLFFTFIAIPIWLPYFFIKGGFKTGKPQVKGIMFSSLSAVVGASGSVCFYFSVLKSHVSLAIPVANMYPLISVLAGIIFLKERPKPLQYAGIPFVIAGLFLIGG